MRRNDANFGVKDNSQASSRHHRVSTLFLVDASVAIESVSLFKHILSVVSWGIRNKIRTGREDFSASVILFNLNTSLFRNGHEVVMKFDNPQVDDLKHLMGYSEHGLNRESFTNTDPKSLLSAFRECYRQFTKLKLQSTCRLVLITPMARPELEKHSTRALVEFLSEEILICPIFYSTMRSQMDTSIYWDEVLNGLPCQPSQTFSLDQLKGGEFSEALLHETAYEPIDIQGKLILSELKINVAVQKMAQPLASPQLINVYHDQNVIKSTKFIAEKGELKLEPPNLSHAIQFDDTLLHLDKSALQRIKSYFAFDYCHIHVERFFSANSLSKFVFLGTTSYIVSNISEEGGSNQAFAALCRSLCRKNKAAEATLLPKSSDVHYNLPRRGILYPCALSSKVTSTPNGLYFVPIPYLDNLIPDNRQGKGEHSTELSIPWLSTLVRKLEFGQGYHPDLFSNPYYTHSTTTLERKALKIDKLPQDINDPLKPRYRKLVQKLDKLLLENSIPHLQVEFPIHYKKLIEHGEYSSLTSLDVHLLSELLGIKLTGDIKQKRQEIESAVHQLWKRSRSDLRPRIEKLEVIFNNKSRLEEIDLRIKSMLSSHKEDYLEDSLVSLALMMHGCSVQADRATNIKWLTKIYSLGCALPKNTLLHVDDIDQNLRGVHENFDSQEEVRYQIDHVSNHGYDQSHYNRIEEPDVLSILGLAKHKLFPQDVRKLIEEDLFDGLGLSDLRVVAILLSAPNRGRTIMEARNNIRVAINKIVEDAKVASLPNERRRKISEFFDNTDVPKELLEMAVKSVRNETFYLLSRSQLMALCKILGFKSVDTNASMSERLLSFFRAKKIVPSRSDTPVNVIDPSNGEMSPKKERKTAARSKSRLSSATENFAKSTTSQMKKELTPGVVLPLRDKHRLSNLIPVHYREAIENLEFTNISQESVGEIEVLFEIKPSKVDALGMRKSRINEFLNSVVEKERISDKKAHKIRKRPKMKRPILRKFLDNLDTPQQLFQKTQNAIVKVDTEFVWKGGDFEEPEYRLLLQMMRIRPESTVEGMKSQILFEVCNERNLKPLLPTSLPEYFPSYLLNALIEGKLNSLNLAELQDVCYILDIDFESITSESLRNAIEKYSRRKQIRSLVKNSKGNGKVEKLRNYLLGLEHARRHHKQVFECYLLNEWEPPDGPDLWALRLVCRMYGLRAWFWWDCVTELKETFKDKRDLYMASRTGDGDEEIEYESDYEEVSEDDNTLFGSNEYYNNVIVQSRARSESDHEKSSPPLEDAHENESFANAPTNSPSTSHNSNASFSFQSTPPSFRRISSAQAPKPGEVINIVQNISAIPQPVQPLNLITAAPTKSPRKPERQLDSALKTRVKRASREIRASRLSSMPQKHSRSSSDDAILKIHVSPKANSLSKDTSIRSHSHSTYEAINSSPTSPELVINYLEVNSQQQPLNNNNPSQPNGTELEQHPEKNAEQQQPTESKSSESREISPINLEIIQRLPPAQQTALINGSLDKLGSKVLQEMCRLFKLGNQGTKDVLIDRLLSNLSTS